MVITVKEYTTKETVNFQEEKYKLFKHYFLNTEMKVGTILSKVLDLNNSCSTTKYIRKRMKEDKLDSDKRRGLILKGEWL